MLKPPISRMGGKSKLRKQIIELIPKHICYVEVFFGAGWVYFGKETSNTEVINDIDSELINLFKMIKYHEEEVSRLLEYEIFSRDSFDYYLNQDSKYLTEIQRAVRFLYIIGCSFGAKGKHFGYGATRKPTQKIFNEDLKVIRDRLKNTYVENLNFKTLIEKYDREGTFFFCDPPYWKTCGYDNPFTWKNHLELKNTLLNIKGKFLLTLNDCPQIRELYKEFNILETEVMYTVSKSEKGIKKHNELIITNY
ncbi:MAG: DNA adenine methylase [Tepidibacter sp.]|jgi:DNA adenine methylase|nr:DNA adenine methylase [Tepidibacter sp.]MCT4507842.1 DNA adenine methylase [Tepidibacter sp.]